MHDTTVLVDIRTSDLTLTQALDVVDRYQRTHPGYEVYLDGDAHAIVSREGSV